MGCKKDSVYFDNFKAGSTATTSSGEKAELVSLDKTSGIVGAVVGGKFLSFKINNSFSFSNELKGELYV